MDPYRDMLHILDAMTFLLFVTVVVEALPAIVALSEQETNRSARLRKHKHIRDKLESPRYLVLDKISEHLAFLERITQDANRECFKNLRMCNKVFYELCKVLQQDCGLRDGVYVSVAEKGCTGALDSTYVPLNIQVEDQARYRTRKDHLATNVLGVCDTQGRFVYMLVSWEGSIVDGRVLQDALARPNRLAVQNGMYYLCDSGYANYNRFLTPYRQTRYNRHEWGGANCRPQNYKELFNLRHATAQNVIERAFRILNKRFAVLRSLSFYPINMHCDIILACGLLHNFVMKVMPLDPLLDPASKHAYIVDKEAKLKKSTRLLNDLKVYTEIHGMTRIRLVEHLMMNEGQYLYWYSTDEEGRAEYVRLFIDGQLD